MVQPAIIRPPGAYCRRRDEQSQVEVILGGVVGLRPRVIAALLAHGYLADVRPVSLSGSMAPSFLPRMIWMVIITPSLPKRPLCGAHASAEALWSTQPIA